MSPTGHGRVLDALHKSDLVRRLIEQGVTYLFYFQYPNVLEQICDPVMLGYHHLGDFSVTTKAVDAYRPDERMGRCIETSTGLRIIEYHYLKEEPPDSWIHTVPASIGTHVFNTSFLDACFRNGVQLPYHKVQHRGVYDAPAPFQKVEQFIFDLMSFAPRIGLVQSDRNNCYYIVKRRYGLNSLEEGKKALSQLYMRWLKEAGAVSATPDESQYNVEISPFYALSAKDMYQKLTKGFCYRNGLLLS